MKKFKIKLNDKVMIIAGKDKGKIGTIFEISKKNDAVKVKGFNVVKKHIKANKNGKVSGIVNVEAFLNISNIMPLDSLTQRPVRHCKFKSEKI